MNNPTHTIKPTNDFLSRRLKNFIPRLIAAAMLVTFVLSGTGYAQICGSIGFYSPVNSPVGGRLQSVDVGDFNLDGKSDLVTANATTTVVSVLLGNGNGTFKTSVDVNAGNSPGDTAIGDFNGDSKPDIAVANSGGNNISELINTCAAAPCSSPSFAAPVNYASGNRPRRITTGDVNRDNILDLMTANENSNSISVLLGNGNGTFKAKVDFNPIGTQPYDVQVGDFNGDNKLDMVAVNFGMGDTASVFINTCNSTPCASPSFAAVVTYAVGESPMGVTVADLNGDNRLDIATANYFSSDVSILLGNGNGTFKAAVNYPSASLPNNITATDLDGDSYLDLVTAVDVGSLISVFRGRGDGTFEAKVDFNVGQSGASDVSKAVAAEDFNGDTLIDLAVAVDMFNNVSIMFNGCGDPPPPPGNPPTITSHPNHQTVTTGASVSFTAAGSGDPTPTVQWQLSTNGGVSFNNIPNATNPTLTFTAAMSQNGYRYRAVMANSLGSATSNAATLTVNKSNSTTTLTSSQNPSLYKKNVTFIATVASASTAAGTPSGTIQFFDNGSPIAGCENAALTSAVAHCTTSNLTAGSHVITSQYSGDANFNTSSGTLTGGQAVTKTARFDPLNSSEWNVAANWDSGAVPGASNDVVIPSGTATYEPTISSADVTVSNLTIEEGRTLTIESGRNLNVTGSLINHGTLNVAGTLSAGNVTSDGKVNFTGGSTPQTLGTGTYNDMTVNSPAGIVLDGDVTVHGTLTLTNGIVSNGQNTLTLGADASISGGSATSYVNGKVRKQFNAEVNYSAATASNSMVFPVGTANGYAPVELLNFIPGAGSFTTSANEGQYSDPASGLPANRLARWWTLTNEGGILSTDVRFNYLAEDITGGTEGSYRVYKIESEIAAMQTTVIDTAANTATVSGVTEFSDWTMAELAPTAAQVPVRGRVVDAYGRGVSNALVILTDGNGEVRIAKANMFGYYRFNNLTVGESYAGSVQHKTYKFTPQVISLFDELTEVNFVAQPKKANW